MARIKSVFETEFAAESWTVTYDKLTRAAGKDGATEIAVSPEEAREKDGAVIQLLIPCTLQLYMAFDATPDEHISIDPNIIVGYGDRLRRAFHGANSSGTTDDMWSLRVRRIIYPDDPTGNKTRLEAQIEGTALNPAGSGL
jgi:hypothetical protein